MIEEGWSILQIFNTLYSLLLLMKVTSVNRETAIFKVYDTC